MNALSLDEIVQKYSGDAKAIRSAEHQAVEAVALHAGLPIAAGVAAEAAPNLDFIQRNRFDAMPRVLSAALERRGELRGVAIRTPAAQYDQYVLHFAHLSRRPSAAPRPRRG